MTVWQVIEGDCRAALPTLAKGSVDAVVCDPPYALGFMGQSWDTAGVAFDPATWDAVLRVAKPGAYLLAAGSPRTYHRLACAVEDAGWALTDCIHHLHGQGFPKGQGQLKPAYEPWLLARKPAPRVRPLRIDAARLPTNDHRARHNRARTGGSSYIVQRKDGWIDPGGVGRWPPNVAFSHAPGCAPDACVAGCPVAELDRQSGRAASRATARNTAESRTHTDGWAKSGEQYGAASRFFPTFRYQRKAPAAERRLPDGTRCSHPTVKPEGLLDWLLRLVAAPGDLVLDPFTGSGTTGVCAVRLGCRFVGVEQAPEYAAYARARIAAAVPAQPSLEDAAS